MQLITGIYKSPSTVLYHHITKTRVRRNLKYVNKGLVPIRHQIREMKSEMNEFRKPLKKKPTSSEHPLVTPT